MRSSKWLGIALLVSVAVNLALAGFLAGRMSHGPTPVMLDPSLSLFRVVRELPQDRRERFRPILREHFDSIRGDLRRMRRAQRNINTSLAQEPFEPRALSSSLDTFRSALLDLQEDNHALLVRVAGSMSPEERLALRDVMTRHRIPHGRDESPRREHR